MRVEPVEAERVAAAWFILRMTWTAEGNTPSWCMSWRERKRRDVGHGRGWMG